MCRNTDITIALNGGLTCHLDYLPYSNKPNVKAYKPIQFGNKQTLCAQEGAEWD